MNSIAISQQTVGIENISTEIPAAYSLYQNYPNPFNPSTNIKFSIRQTENRIQKTVAKLIVYDITGKEVAVLLNEALQRGTYEVTFDGSGLTSGVYFYKLQAGDYTETKRMVMIK